MIRCIKLWTGADEKSHFEEGFIDLEPGASGDALSVKCPITSVSFHETDADPKLGWHPDHDRQLVITLSGTLEFETPDGRFCTSSGRHTFHRGHTWSRPQLEDGRRPALVPRLHDPRSEYCRSLSTGHGWPEAERVCVSQHHRSKPMIRCVRIWTGDDRNRISRKASSTSSRVSEVIC